MGAHESCYECGHSWGVTCTPRTRVLCSGCFRAHAARHPGLRADAAIRRLWQKPLPRGRDAARVAAADRYTSLCDLRAASEFGHAFPLVPGVADA